MTMNIITIDAKTEDVSWSNLYGIFRDKELSMIFEDLERRYNVVNEADFFARLVNMSTANKEAFHRWIRYREGYAGELVKEILRRYPVNSDTHYVLDPMCGSGSSLVACGELGIDGLGLDVNGYAVLSSNVKSHIYTDEEITEISSSIDAIELLSSVADPSCATHAEDILKYFPEKNFRALVGLRAWINEKSYSEFVTDFLNLGLLAILEDCSDRKKDGNGLATRPAPVSDVLLRFVSQLKLMHQDVSTYSRLFVSKRRASDCSALSLRSAASEFGESTGKALGSIIFSPPYANSFDYFESYKLELIFGGFVLGKDLNEARRRLIRNYRITAPKEVLNRIECVERLCSEIADRIPEKEAETGTRDGRTRLVPNMLRGYFEDMGAVIAGGFSALSPGGTMHIVVDQSAYVGIPIPTDLIFGMLAEDVGFEVSSVINCRRANTSGQQLKKFPYLKSLLRESIVSLTKPIARVQQ